MPKSKRNRPGDPSSFHLFLSIPPLDLSRFVAFLLGLVLASVCYMNWGVPATLLESLSLFRLANCCCLYAFVTEEI